MKGLDLAKHNCELLREGANHSIYLNNDNGKQTAIPRHREIGENTGQEICKQLGIPLMR